MRLRLLFATFLLCVSVAGGHARQSGERQALIDSLNVRIGKAVQKSYVSLWQKFVIKNDVTTESGDKYVSPFKDERGLYAMSKTSFPLTLAKQMAMKGMGIDTKASTKDLRSQLDYLQLSDRMQGSKFTTGLTKKIFGVMGAFLGKMKADPNDEKAQAEAEKTYQQALAEIKPKDEETLRITEDGLQSVSSLLDSMSRYLRSMANENKAKGNEKQKALWDKFLTDLPSYFNQCYASSMEEIYTKDEMRRLCSRMKNIDVSGLITTAVEQMSGNSDVAKYQNNPQAIIDYANNADAQSVVSFLKQLDPASTLTASDFAQKAKLVKLVIKKPERSNAPIGVFDVKGNDEDKQLKVKEVIKTEEPRVDEQKVFDVVDHIPMFPGGDAALMQYLNSNIKYPAEAKKNCTQGRVIVSFVVERDGSISDVKVLKSADPLLDEEAIRVTKSMPKWIPGKIYGTPVRVKYTLPVTFRMS